MQWLLLILGTMLVVECFFRLPMANLASRLNVLIKKIMHTIGSQRISDHWKELVLPTYAGQLFLLSLNLFAVMCLALSPMLLIGIVGELADLKFSAFLATPLAIVISTAFAIAYAVLRKKAF